MADNIRSIPSMIDGFKPGQRKVIFACFKRNLRDDIKVSTSCIVVGIVLTRPLYPRSLNLEDTSLSTLRTITERRPSMGRSLDLRSSSLEATTSTSSSLRDSLELVLKYVRSPCPRMTPTDDRVTLGRERRGLASLHLHEPLPLDS
jgi:hypothetical protein